MYQLPVFDWKACGPDPRPKYYAGPSEGYGPESGLSEVSDEEDWNKDEHGDGRSEASAREHPGQSGTGESGKSGSESGLESGPESGLMTNYIDAPRPLSTHGDAGEAHLHYQDIWTPHMW